MRTSISHRSPTTPNWNAAALAYTSETIEPDRATQEIWRAATSQPIGDIAADIGTLVIARCLQIVMSTASPDEAYRLVTREIALSGQSNLATDIVRRAVISGCRRPGDRALNFVKSLFSHAVDYLISRDISGYVGTNERIRNVSASIEFKKSLREQVINIIDSFPPPRETEQEPANWRKYVNSLVSRLASKEYNV